MNDSRVEFGMPAETYHETRALGASGIRDILTSPYHYWAKHLNPARPEQEQTPAMAAGTLLHTLVLEPHRFNDRYAIKPRDMSFATKEGKEWRAQVPAGVEIISAQEHATAQSQLEAILCQVPDVWALLTTVRAKQEVSVFWRDTKRGIECKARPDCVHAAADGAILLDLKTARDSSPEGFARAVANMGYHRQAAWYSRGWEIASGQDVKQFIFVVVSTQYPFAAAAYTLDADALQQGADECDAAVDIYADCWRRGEWPGYGKTVQEISLPPYARASNEVEISWD